MPQTRGAYKRQNLFPHSPVGWEIQDECAAWQPQARSAFWLIDGDFSECPHLVEGLGELSGSSICKGAKVTQRVPF